MSSRRKACQVALVRVALGGGKCVKALFKEVDKTRDGGQYTDGNADATVSPPPDAGLAGRGPAGRPAVRLRAEVRRHSSARDGADRWRPWCGAALVAARQRH